MKIRQTTINDISSMLNIYSKYIDTSITFEYNLPTEEEFQKRIKNIIEVYPSLVYEDNNKIVGYCYAHRFMEREAYNWNAELSIYLNDSNTSKGIGKKLYSILIEILKYQGIKNVYAKITSDNIKSKNMHTSLGFVNIGIYHNVGYKCGKWHDVFIFEKEICECNNNPKEIIPITKIPNEKIINIINKFL